MKRIALAAALATLIATSALAASIKDSKHDLSVTTGSGSTIKASLTTDGGEQICIFCHTPHTPTKVIPLWNRSNPATAGWTYYKTGTNLSDEAKNFTGLPADSVSLFCLSCHDGGAAGTVQTSIGDRVVNSRAAGGKITMAAGGTWTNGGLFDGANSLSNDHPIGFNYDTVVTEHGAGVDFFARGVAEGKGAKFFVSGYDATGAADKIECSSCHKVHDPGTDAAGTKPFLRTTNTGSALCLACHDK